MQNKIILFAILAIVFASCKHINKTLDQVKHEDHKFQYTAYSNDYELFAEADPFIIGETANVLSHFSVLPEFKAVETGKITVILNVNGTETKQTLDKPTRKGIYSFDIKPEMHGKGFLKFEIANEKGILEVLVPEITVFANFEEAHKTAKKIFISKTNTSVFTKEQSWKIDFSTDYPIIEPFGQVIKTTAEIQSTQSNEIIVTAKANGVVMLATNNFLEGEDVSNGQVLFTISGSEFADNNFSVQFTEAKNNFEKTKADYERAKELSMDKIVSEKDLLYAKNLYYNAKATYDNLNKNFNTSGQKVISPMSGFVKQIFVKNGKYVVAGQPILTISQNKTLILSADVQQKYASVLSLIQSANIRTVHDNQVYSLEQLDGKILSYGKAANTNNYLIPVNLQIDNKGNFTPGGFVEIFLKTLTNQQALTIPNSSLLEEQGNYFVYVQITPELFEKREVTTGKSDGIKTEILKGLKDSNRIVAKGAIYIKLAQTTSTLDAHSGHVH